MVEGGGQPNLGNACILGVSGPATPPLGWKMASWRKHWRPSTGGTGDGDDYCNYDVSDVDDDDDYLNDNFDDANKSSVKVFASLPKQLPFGL